MLIESKEFAIARMLEEQFETPPENWRHSNGQTWPERCEAWTEFVLDKLEDELSEEGEANGV